MSDIAALVDADVAIAVQVLRMANSALYSPSREITTISRALTALGLRAVKLLALTTSLRSLVPQQSDAIDLGEIRHRMVVTASVARRAAELFDPPVRDEAFVAGLLTGIGPIVLASEAPNACRRILGQAESWPGPQAEHEVLGFTTDEITSELASRWGLPSVFAEAIRHRHDEFVGGAPDEHTGGGASFCLAVATLAEPILTGRDDGSSLEAIRSFLAATRDMEADAVDAWLIDAQPAVADAAAMLQFRIDRRLAASMERPSPALGLLVLDLDHFKAVNDTHGHAAGDDVLRTVGATLQRQTRGADFTARFGGEEFVMLIPSATPEGLLAIAERLRTSIAELAIPLTDGTILSVTTSIGGAMVANLAGPATARALIEAADQRLYEAKQSGRNRCCIG